MKSRKITENAAREIATKIVHIAFEAEMKALDERQADLAPRIKTALCSDEQAAIIRALPAHLQPTARMNVFVETSTERRGNLFEFDEVIFCAERYVGLTELGPDLYADICTFDHDCEQSRQRRSALAQDILANIRRAETTSRLIASWPEATPIILEHYQVAEHVETPLETILGRYLAPALPAPQHAAANAEQAHA